MSKWDDVLSALECRMERGEDVPVSLLRAAMAKGLWVWLVQDKTDETGEGRIVACCRACAEDQAEAINHKILECLGRVDEDDPEGTECDCCGSEW